MDLLKFKKPDGEIGQVYLAKGRDGHTPVKGEDYWTAEDQAEMINSVMDEFDEYKGEEGYKNTLNEYLRGTKTEITAEDLKGITAIRDYMFYMSNITSVTFSDTVTYIGRNAFANTQIERFIMPDSVTSGNVYICNGCTKLKEFVIGKGITKTGNGWIDGCTALEYVEIPDNVTSIAWYFFQRCSNLKIVKFGRGITLIESCFSGCTSLKEIIILAENPPTLNAQNLDQIPADCIFKVLPTSLEAYKSATNWSERADYIMALTDEEVLQYGNNEN